MVSVLDDLPKNGRNPRSAGDNADVTQSNAVEKNKLKKFCILAAIILIVAVCAIAFSSVNSESEDEVRFIPGLLDQNYVHQLHFEGFGKP